MLMGNKLKLNINKTRSMILYQSKNSFWKKIDFNVKQVEQLQQRQTAIEFWK